MLLRLGVGRSPSTRKLVNRVFSAFDPEMRDGVDVTEFCAYFETLRELLRRTANSITGKQRTA